MDEFQERYELQKAAANKVAESRRRNAIQKCADLAALQIQAARGVLASQQLPETPDAVLRVAQIIATNWTNQD